MDIAILVLCFYILYIYSKKLFAYLFNQSSVQVLTVLVLLLCIIVVCAFIYIVDEIDIVRRRHKTLEAQLNATRRLMDDTFAVSLKLAANQQEEIDRLDHAVYDIESLLLPQEEEEHAEEEKEAEKEECDVCQGHLDPIQEESPEAAE